MEVVIKIEVKDNNVDQALRILKKKLQREGFFKILKIKSNYEKPSERKKREKSENIRRAKKIQRMRNNFWFYLLVKKLKYNIKIINLTRGGAVW